MKVRWSKWGAVCALAWMASVLSAAELTRAEWLGKVGDCANNAATMRATMANVSASDQVALVSAVNAALAKSPGSNEQRAAAFVRANVAALSTAMTQNKEKHAANQVLAEIYATVPPEYLPVVSEQFAKETLNRKNLERPQFVNIMTNTLHLVDGRLAKAENGGVREAFVALTFIKASGEAPSADLVNLALSQISDAKTRETAANEWLGPALGMNGVAQSYDPMLGAANADDEPDRSIVAKLLAGESAVPAGTPAQKPLTPAATSAKPEVAEGEVNPEVLRPVVVLLTGGSDISVALLGDLAAEGSPMQTPSALIGGGIGQLPGVIGAVPNDLASDIGLNRTPRAYVNSKNPVGGMDENPYYRHGRKGKGKDHTITVGEECLCGDCCGYAGQKLKAW